jgi:hypothetical protein
MNIFVLDQNPRLAGMMHCDKHVSKMLLESAQMICTTINHIGGVSPYKTSHLNHPCSVWARASSENLNWLSYLAKELNNQYRVRYNKDHNHKSWEVIKHVIKHNETLITEKMHHIGPTPFVLAMPEQYKCSDPVQAYRAYYKSKEFAQWNKGVPTPYWW